jgi:hypothetical protein
MIKKDKSRIKCIGLFFLVFGFLSFGQEIVIENDSLILWRKDRLLTWNDFEGMPKNPKGKMGIHEAAVTATGPVFVHHEDNKGNLIPYPLCYFYKSLSWSITEDSLLLAHEQLHFDIQEVYIRKMRMRFIELSEQNIYDSSVYSSLSNKILKECAEVQSKYDKEVSFNKVKQNEWRKCIDKELEELKEYEFVPEQ